MKAPLCLAVRDSQEGSHGIWLLDVSSFSDPEVLWNMQLFFSFEKHVPGRLPIQTTGVLTLLTSCTAWVIICGIPIAKVQNHDNPPLILHHYIVLNIYVHIQTIIKMHLHPHTPIYTSTQTYISTYTRTHRTTGCTPPTSNSLWYTLNTPIFLNHPLNGHRSLGKNTERFALSRGWKDPNCFSLLALYMYLISLYSM